MSYTNNHIKRTLGTTRHVTWSIACSLRYSLRELCAFVVFVPVGGLLLWLPWTLFLTGLGVVVGGWSVLVGAFVALPVIWNYGTGIVVDDFDDAVYDIRPGAWLLPPLLYLAFAVETRATFDPLLTWVVSLFVVASFVSRTLQYGLSVETMGLGPTSARAYAVLAYSPLVFGGFCLGSLLPAGRVGRFSTVTTVLFEPFVVAGSLDVRLSTVLWGIPLVVSATYLGVQAAASIPARLAGRHPGRPQPVHEHLREVSEHRSQATSLQAAGDYSDAFAACQRALAACTTAEQTARDFGYTREDHRIDAIRDSIRQQIDDIRADVAHQKVTSRQAEAEQLVERAESTAAAIDTDDPDEASDRYDDVLDTYEEAIETLADAIQIGERYGISVVSDLEDRRTEISDARVATAKQQVEYLQQLADDRLAEASDYREGGEYDAAMRAYRNGRHALERAREVADDRGRTTVVSEIDTELNVLEETVRDRARSEVAHYREHVDELVAAAENRREDEEFAAAIEVYETAIAICQEALDVASEHSLSEPVCRLQNRLAELQEDVGATKRRRALAEAMDYREQIDQRAATAENEREAGEFAAAIGAYEDAIEICREALEVGDEHSLPGPARIELQTRLADLGEDREETRAEGARAENARDRERTN